MKWLALVLVFLVGVPLLGEYNPTFFSSNAVRGARGYSNVRSITIDNTKVGSSTHTDFPVLISGTYAYLKTMANGGMLTNSNGYDVVFSSDASGNTLLSYEIETYSATTGAVNYWVKVPSVSHSAPTVIYMWYGNPAITTSQQNVSGTWDSGYQAVYHLPDGTSLNVNDSTSNARNLTNVNATTATAGQVDGGGDFNGSSQTLVTTTITNIESSNIRTVSLWMKPDSLAGTLPRLIAQSSSTDGVPANIWGMTFNGSGDAGPNSIQMTTRIAGISADTRTNNNVISSTSAWYYIVAVVTNTPTVAAIYVNGVSQTLNAGSSLGSGSVVAMNIGARVDSTRYFDGKIDEVRISTTTRSADWVTAEYNNQSSPSTFYTISNPL